MTTNNTFFAFLFSLFLLGPAGLCFAGFLELDLPCWLTASDSQYLAGGIETVEINEYLDIEAFESEQLQDALEKEIGNNIPLKSTALLTNAALQRSCIEVSNRFFDWDCFPTFFGSNRVYARESDSLYRMPYNYTNIMTQQFDAFVSYMDEIAAVYPEKQFCVYLVDGSQYDSANPARDLVHYNCFDIDESAVKANGSISSGNLLFVGDTISESMDYHSYFYSTDHHWNGYGTRRAFQAIAQATGLDMMANPIKGQSSFEGLRINGSDARVGLMLLDELVKEPLFTFPNTKVVQGDSAPVFTSGVGFAESIPLEAEFDFYHAWFGKGSLTLENDLREGKVLLIGDSYTYSLRWLLSNSCNRVVQRADFSSGQQVGVKERHRTMRNLIDATSPNRVIVVSSPGDLISMVGTFEGYFL